VSRRSTPERIYEAGRAAHVSRLAGTGMAEERAEAWADAWEAEGARRGLDRHGDTFWRNGGGWIDEQRNWGRKP
jgi:hypothetical protein